MVCSGVLIVCRCMHDAEMHCLCRAGRTPLWIEATDVYAEYRYLKGRDRYRKWCDTSTQVLSVDTHFLLYEAVRYRVEGAAETKMQVACHGGDFLRRGRKVRSFRRLGDNTTTCRRKEPSARWKELFRALNYKQLHKHPRWFLPSLRTFKAFPPMMLSYSTVSHPKHSSAAFWFLISASYLPSFLRLGKSG